MSIKAVAPLRWAFTDPQQEVPIPALGANVAWNLATNALFALSLIAARLG